MKNIDFYQFGNPNSFITPTWHCLLEVDQNLINYYNQVLSKPYDKKRFRRPGVFRDIGVVRSKESYSDFKGIRCLDMPIKMAGGKDYRIPEEFNQWIEPISQMIAFEHGHNDKTLDYYAYLTVDQSETKNKDYHRESGLHVDGYQGARIQPKVACTRSYIVTDCDTPSFWNQAFDTIETLDDSNTNIFHEFDRKAHYSSEIRSNPYHIYFMDSYCVHSANIRENERRTFLRLSYSVRIFDRKGNSHNNAFDYKWEMIERDIASSLS